LKWCFDHFFVGKKQTIYFTTTGAILMIIEQLNSDFGIAGQLEVVEGAGGFPFIKINHPQAQALISVYSGQVLAFRPQHTPQDLMFLSDKAYYQAGKAIKGGVPICWPWFGPDPQGLGRSAHGFVRNRLWNLKASQVTAAGEVQVSLGLTDTEETRALWPQAFELDLVVTVAQELTIELTTLNTDSETFSITQALHTYFQVGDIGQTQVLGLEDIAYIDKVEQGVNKVQKGPVLIHSEVDRIYTHVANPLVIVDPQLQRRIAITSQGSHTAVVWNPGPAICAQMADLEDDAYQNFICVETANAGEELVTLRPGEVASLVAVYSVEQD